MGLSDLDPAARAVLAAQEAAMAAAPPPHPDELEAVREARAGYIAGTAALNGPPEEVGHVEDLGVPGPGGEVPVRLYRPEGQALGTVVFLHGGAWILGDRDTHDGVCRALCAASVCAVVSVDYRLAPESPFPAAVDDGWAALGWAAAEARRWEAPPGRLAVAGDSAGGALAAALARRARDAGGPTLALQALLYPALDAAMDSESYVENDGPYGLGRAEMERAWRLYLGRPPGPEDLAQAEYSPGRAEDLAGLAPALVLVAQLDVLREDGVRYAAALTRAGVPTTLLRYRGLPHGFLRWRAGVPAARRALDEVAEAIRRAMRGDGRPPR